MIAMHRPGSKAGALALVLLACLPLAPAASQPFPPRPPDRRETVAGWRVVHVYDQDDGRDVGMTISREGIRIAYYANYWRGNGRPFRRVEIMRGGAQCGGEQWEPPHPPRAFPPEPDVAGDGRRLRARMVRYLATCGVTGPRAERLLQGFTPAFARVAVFAEQARRYVEAFNCSIENVDQPPARVRALCHRS